MLKRIVAAEVGPILWDFERPIGAKSMSCPPLCKPSTLNYGMPGQFTTQAIRCGAGLSSAAAFALGPGKRFDSPSLAQTRLQKELAELDGPVMPRRTRPTLSVLALDQVWQVLQPIT